MSAKIFKNKFLSTAGQKERLQNVGSTLKAALTGQGVQSNTGVKAVDKVLSAAASNPFTTAAVVTPANTLGAAKAGFQALSTGGKVATVAAAPVVASVVLTSPDTIKKAASAPRSAAQFGSNVTEFINEPSVERAKDIVRDNPIIAGGAAALGIGALGAGTAGLIGTAINTRATKQNTEALQNIPGLAAQTGNNVVPSSQYTSPTGPMPPATSLTTSNRSISTARRRRAIKQQTATVVRVTNNIINANQSRIGRFKYKRR